MIVSAERAPAVAGSAWYWERCEDPFHADAFKGIDLSNTVLLTFGGEVRGGARKSGWMAIDWCENPVGWIADGTEVPDHEQQHVHVDGPYEHLCAFQVGSEKHKEHVKCD